ncbi:iron-sulfur cluster biosynthesis family protein [Enterococcus diestrammenae]|uniref:iron-sulfur cluster biosynthesis family protein n=1 Tax=Enterococcus diestrammenae TaxID=1155073 RepID=UPI0022E8C39B|nr:iron-sulfur cluster biosynthesis family protein [Enterococcus diestrammenae]
MKLTIDEAAKKRIAQKMQPSDHIYLDFEDGAGPFAHSSLTCRLDLSFRVLLVAADYPNKGLEVYDEILETTLGPVKLKKSSEVYLDPETQLVIGDGLGALQLKGPSGVLADNIPIIRMTAASDTLGKGTVLG